MFVLPVCKAVGDQKKLDKILLDFSGRNIQRKWLWYFVKFVYFLNKQMFLNKYLVQIMCLNFLDAFC